MLYKKQRGAALAVTLLLMTVGLLLAVTGMQTSRNNEVMGSNYRASERALMAAEYGASYVASAIAQSELGDITLAELFSKLPVSIDDGKPHQVDSNSYYFISTDYSSAIFNSSVPVSITGKVISGDINGTHEVVAERTVTFGLGVDTQLPALSLNCPSEFLVPSNSAEIEGQSLDGVKTYNPAVSLGTQGDAIEAVKDILSTSYVSPDKTVVGDNSGKTAIFMDSDGVGVATGNSGTYHAGIAVVKPKEGEYYVDYAGCKPSNPMCTYKGGISTDYGAPILGSLPDLSYFVNTLFGDNRIAADGNPAVVVHVVTDGGDDNVESVDFSGFVNGKINIYTTNEHLLFADREGGGLSGLVASADEDVFAGSPLLFSQFSTSDALAVDADGNSYLDLFLDTNMNPASPSWQASLESGLVYYDGGFGLYNLDSTELSSSSPRDADDVIVKSDNLEAVAGAGSLSPLFFVKNSDMNTVTSTGDVRYPYSVYFPSEIPYLSLSSGTVSSIGTIDLDETHLIGNDALGSNDGVERLHFDGSNLKVKKGVLLVDGSLTLQGVSSFEGLLITLGDFKVGGGGVGSKELRNINGAAVVAPFYLKKDGSDFSLACQPAVYDATGGGNLDLEYDQDALIYAFSILSDESVSAWAMGSGLSGEVSSWVEQVQNN